MNLGTSKKKYLSKTIDYISKTNWKHVSLFLVFLIISFTYWMLLFTEKDVRHAFQLPVIYTNKPLDVAFDTPLTDTFTINVESKGANIIKSTFSNKPSIIIDVQKYYDENITEIQGEELKAMFKEKLNIDVSEIKSYYPVSIPLKISKLQQKEVDIIFDGEITTAQNNLVAEPFVITPSKVTVYGSARQLENISYVSTEFTEIKEISKTSTFNVALVNSNDEITLDPTSVEIEVPILVYTERTVEVPINVTNIPDGRDIKLFPSQATISFSVTLEDYKRISPEDFVIELNYRDFYDNKNARVNLEVTSNPSSARNINISPNTVEFLIEKR